MFSKNDFIENTIVATFNYNNNKVSVPGDLTINIIRSFDVYRAHCNYCIYSKWQAMPYQHHGHYTSEADALSAFFTAWDSVVTKQDETEKWGFVKVEEVYDLEKAKIYLANGKTISRAEFDNK